MKNILLSTVILMAAMATHAKTILGNGDIGSVDTKCLEQVREAGEKFATNYMGIGVISSHTVLEMSQETEERTHYLVETINHDGTRIRTVKVGVSKELPNCTIESLEEYN